MVDAPNFSKGVEVWGKATPCLISSTPLWLIPCRNIEVECISGNLLGIKFFWDVKSLNHSQFVDDTLFLGNASIIIATIFNYIFEYFLLSFVGEVNHQKCQIFGWNANIQVIHFIYRTLKIPLSENRSSFRYLGIPIYLKNHSSQSWSSIIDKIKTMFGQWGS
jgi:hypothetical protein